MSVPVGIGAFPGQVPIGHARPVADAHQDILALARVAGQAEPALRLFADELIPAPRRPVAAELAR